MKKRHLAPLTRHRAPRATTAALMIAVLTALPTVATAQSSQTTTTQASAFAVPQPNSVGVPVSVTTSPLPTSPTSTTVPPVTVTLSHEIASGFSNANQPLGPQRTIINVVNQSSATLFNQQMVVRMGTKPDTIFLVRDSTGSVGVIDGPSGIWFHTIAQLNPNSSALFTVTWNKACPGRWPLGARVGDSLSWQVYQWISPAPGPNCLPDDTAKPEPQTLPWPASFPTPSVIAPIIATSTTVPVVAGSTTTTIKSTVAVAPSVIPPPPIVTRPPTTMIFCRTVAKKRVCGPAAKKPKSTPTKQPTKATTTTKS